MKKILMFIVLASLTTTGAYASGNALNSLRSAAPSILPEAKIFPRAVIEKAKRTDTLDRSKRSHMTTWTTLIILQFVPKEVFAHAGGLIVDDGQVTLAGHMHAAQAIDDIFVDVRGAKRVEGVNQYDVIVGALSDKGMTLKEFADLMGKIYVFYAD